MKIKLKKLYCNNKWHKPNSRKIFTHKTFNGVDIEIPNANKVDVTNSIASALSAQENFNNTSGKKKSEILNKISNLIRLNADQLAKKEVLELGKNFIDAKNEIISCAKLWRHASQELKKNNSTIIKKNRFKLYEGLEPVGLVALIIPWNFPMLVLSERLPYILAAGNTVVIKSSEHGSLSIENFIRLIKKAGIPSGVINFITGDYKTGREIISNKSIKMISFTGSTKTGKEIYKSASKSIKRLSLELGGKNPMIVFLDAELKNTIDDVVFSFTHNAGQCCVAGSKLFIHKKIFEIFIKKTKNKLDSFTNFQSTATHNQYKKIKKIILQSLKKRIPILYRSKKLFDDKKRIIYPIIFMPNKKVSFLEEEIFGPVLCVYQFDNEKKLIKKINDTSYGLSALIWTKNTKKAISFASSIKFGRIWINGNISQNFPEISIGGFNESGLARETGISGIKTYSEIKSIVINR